MDHNHVYSDNDVPIIARSPRKFALRWGALYDGLEFVNVAHRMTEGSFTLMVPDDEFVTYSLETPTK